MSNQPALAPPVAPPPARRPPPGTVARGGGIGWPRRLAVAAALALCAACTPQRHRGGVEFLPAPPAGPVDRIVSAEQQRAEREGRKVLVYVGATWCEPCQRFHQAATAGKLDGFFGGRGGRGLRLIEFDSDRDSERLASAGYISRFIPLFARPLADGRSSGRQIEGSIKGDGAVEEIAPRLRQLLSD